VARALEVHPAASGEAIATTRWYFERSQVAAAAFELAITYALEYLAEFPESCPPHIHGTRRYVIERFRHDVVFRLTPDAIQVVAFASHRRKPGYWSER
jgi:toxin ParE1/3/4